MPAAENRNLIDPLRRLGFSDLEATVYIDLLKRPASTGYAIGKSIGKPHANVYQSLVSLVQKGAVLFEEGEAKLYSAVPPDELIDNLRARHERECQVAEQALKALIMPAPDEERFLRLSSPEQVFARARAMIREAREAVLIESFPLLMRSLRDDLKEAADRGISVAGIVLQEEDLIEGTRLRVSPIAERVTKAWRGHQLILIIDAMEFLLALFRSDGEVERAVWVTSPFVAATLNNGIVADVVLHAMPEAAKFSSFNEEVFGFLPPGCRALISSYAGSGEADEPNQAAAGSSAI